MPLKSSKRKDAANRPERTLKSQNLVRNEALSHFLLCFSKINNLTFWDSKPQFTRLLGGLVGTVYLLQSFDVTKLLFLYAAFNKVVVVRVICRCLEAGSRYFNDKGHEQAKR